MTGVSCRFSNTTPLLQHEQAAFRKEGYTERNIQCARNISNARSKGKLTQERIAMHVQEWLVFVSISESKTVRLFVQYVQTTVR